MCLRDGESPDPWASPGLIADRPTLPTWRLALQTRQFLNHVLPWGEGLRPWIALPARVIGERFDL